MHEFSVGFVAHAIERTKPVIGWNNVAYFAEWPALCSERAGWASRERSQPKHYTA